jgi:Lipoprotein LpqB beta-propeller domain/Sporulation and spore germination
VARFRLPKGLRRMCVLAAVVASVTGCVGMPSGGPAGEFTAGPQNTTQDVNLIGPYPAGPLPDGSPSQVVQGFLLASASYPYYKVADQYLVSSAITNWTPGWAVRVFNPLSVPKSAELSKAGRHGTEQASVDVTGVVQASYDGSGQYVSAQGQGQAEPGYLFRLVKVGGQWRIMNPPDYRMLLVEDFSLFYKAEDLYFFDSGGHVLIPDSVFVPLGVTSSQLLDNLVSALSEGPKTPWLENAADTEFPAGANGDNDDVLSVSPEGTYVTVNLGGPVARDAKQLPLIAAQLVWTLTGSPASSLPNIQSVELEINGQPWTPREPPCKGGRTPGVYQTRAAYECFNPYPSSSTSFYYTDGGQAWARCGSEAWAASQGMIGLVVPVVSRTGGLSIGQCSSSAASFVHEQSTAPPSTQPQSLPAASMVAVSPDRKYLAIVSPGGDALYIGKISGDAVSFPRRARLTGTGITALSWDRSDDLWVAKSGDVLMIQASGGRPIQVQVAGGNVTDLSVAPDGVRIAYISQNAGLLPALYLAAIGGGQQGTGELRGATASQSISDVAAIGPGITDPASLAWYDADDLIVLNDAATGNTLWEVPVDGQQAQAVANPPGNATSITADGTANVLVAGVSGNALWVSTGLEGPWYPLGNPGANPAYPG